MENNVVSADQDINPKTPWSIHAIENIIIIKFQWSTVFKNAIGKLMIRKAAKAL